MLDRIERLEENQKITGAEVEKLKLTATVQTEKTSQLFCVMEEIKGSLQRIETAVYNKEDPFKKAMFDIGIWSIKVLVGGGSLIWAASKFGN